MYQHLMSDAVTPEEQALNYFTYNKLKKLLTQEAWKAEEKRQSDQFNHQGMFVKPKDPDGIPKDAMKFRSHCQYTVKQSNIRQSCMCCNGFKKTVP